MTTFVLDPNTDIVASVPRFTRPFQRRSYRDKQYTELEWKKRLDASTTVYVGNLSCYTNECQIYELFSRCGSIKRLIMGLDKFKKTPCGFCFVEYDERESAVKSTKYLNRTHLDGRDIQIDLDAGFEEGRQYGRGASGGQLGDERRREREAQVAQSQRTGYQTSGSPPILTRSITIVACISLISVLLLAQQPDLVEAGLVFRPLGYMGAFDKGRFLSVSHVREAQLTESRDRFEKELAQFLVNLMKSSKPTLMRAFMQATLNDKQLKETAISIFFNTTDTDANRR